MDSAKISQLAQLLRNSGDKVLNDQYKLTLSGQLLQGLSDSFRVIVDDADELAGGNGGIHGADDASHFQVVSKYHNAKTPEMRDLQLIYDFVQKTRILCVTRFTTNHDDDATVDITKFRNLRRLEINKLSVARVRGIQKMRAHLRELKCVHSIESVEEIISHCGGDRCNGFMWNELHTVDFSYNMLRTVDCSLEFVTALQYLNLSHNQIVSVDAIKWLKNLKYLNLSFNRLPFVPLLHVEAPRRLKSLILANNNIEDMTGLSRLDALSELDLSDNYLLDHSVLLPLSTLIGLQTLNLSGNPLACHPKHRQMTAKYLHNNTATGLLGLNAVAFQFQLDNQPLSKAEKSLTGQHKSVLGARQSFFSFTRRLTTASMISSSSHRSTTTNDNSPASSVGSLRSLRLLDDSTLTGSQKSLDIVYRKVRPKTAAIAEHPPGTEPLLQSSVTASSVEAAATAGRTNPATVIAAISTAAHLETKKQIEEMRQQHGDSWLKSHGATLGHDSNDVGATDLGTSPLINPNRLDRMQTSTPLPAPSTDPLDQSETTAYQTALMTTHNALNEDSTTGYSSAGDDLAEIFPATPIAAPEDEHPPSEPEENEVMYIVTQQPSLCDMFLVVSETNIREKDALTGQTVTKWAMSMLESCDRMRTDVLRLNFDTLNRDRRERIYRVETGLCQQLERYLRALLAQRPLSEMNQVQYRCMKCSVTFSRETGKSKPKSAPETRCPNCGSSFLVEMHESPPKATTAAAAGLGAAVTVQPPPPNVEQRPVAVTAAVAPATTTTTAVANGRPRSEEITGVDEPKAVPLQPGESQSSIGSAQSLNESSSCSRISKSSSFDSNRSVDGSFGLAGRFRRAADFAADRRSLESDVEILSNPSQSSIEVLEYNASRKHSEDRRYEEYAGLESFHQSMALSLDTVADRINGLSVASSTDVATATAPTTTTTTTQHQQTSTRDLVALVADETRAAAETETKVPATVTLPPLAAVLAQANLTESSSSGSVTDSICTAYDQNQRTITSSNASSMFSEGLRSPEKVPSSEVRQDASMISSMLGGLFQSTNNLMSRSQRHNDATSVVGTTTQPFQFSYVDFNEVDHRLKLYLYQSVFEDDNEQLKWLVRGQVLLDRPTVANKWQHGPALFVMSTTKFYVLQITAAESDDVSKWVKRQLAGTIDRLQTVRVLPWKIGLTISIKGIGTLQLLLQDILRTDSLLLFFANNPLPDTCCLKYQPAEELAAALLLTTSNAPLKMLAILAECTCSISPDSETSNNQTSAPKNVIAAPQKLLGLIVTETHLYLLEAAHLWLTSDIDPTAAARAPTAVQHQQMNNLVAAEQLTDRVVRLIYLEEMQDRQEEWMCTFETDENASSTLDAVSQSWERLFGVPLTAK